MVGKPKVLIYDLEFHASQNYKNQLKIEPGYIICFCCKVLGEPKMTTYSMRTHPGKTLTDDRNLVEAIGNHIRDADLHVYQYGNKTEYPFIQTKLLKYGFPPLPVPPVAIDTCKIAQEKLGLKSNSLASLARFFGLKEQKMPITEDQWHLAFAGDEKTMRLVEKRCASDVRLTEQIYLKLRPIISNHPAIYKLYGSGEDCQACGGTLNKWGKRPTGKKIYQRYKCTGCGMDELRPIKKDAA